MQILCATDFSSLALAAADVAACFAKKLGLPLRLIHCSHPPMVLGDMPAPEPGEAAERAQLCEEAARLRFKGVEVIEELRRGRPAAEIVQAVDEQATKLVVLGSTGGGGARQWLLGRVAERVAENAAAPTLIVRQPEALCSWLDDARTLRILCGVDFTATSDAALAETRGLCDLGTVEMEAVHIRSSDAPGVPREEPAQNGRVEERLRSLLGSRPVKVHVYGAFGPPEVAFLDAVGRLSAGLVVVGTHQRHGIRRLKAPSFSRSVITHSFTNVLCVPVSCTQHLSSVPPIYRVLVATNFTAVCAEAARYAYSLLGSGGEIHFVHVCIDPMSGLNPVFASEVYFDHSLATTASRQEAEKKLRALLADLPQMDGLSASSEVLVHHDVATAICEVAERSASSVICMGTRAHSRIGAALLGSTVQAVLATTHKPVLIIPPSAI